MPCLLTMRKALSRHPRLLCCTCTSRMHSLRTPRAQSGARHSRVAFEGAGCDFAQWRPALPRDVSPSALSRPSRLALVPLPTPSTENDSHKSSLVYTGHHGSCAHHSSQQVSVGLAAVVPVDWEMNDRLDGDTSAGIVDARSWGVSSISIADHPDTITPIWSQSAQTPRRLYDSRRTRPDLLA